MAKELVIRPSTVYSYMLCGGRPGLQKLVPQYPSEALLFGSATHWLIEHRLRGTSKSLAEIRVALSDLYVKDIDDPSEGPTLKQVTTKEQRKQMATEVRDAVDKWEREVVPELPDETPDVERTIGAYARYQSGDTPAVIVRGTPDAVYPEAGLIVDWKTAGRMWGPKKVEGQIQPIAYPWMYEAATARTKDLVSYPINKFQFWIYDRHGEWWSDLNVDMSTLSPHAVPAFKLAATAAAMALDTYTWSWNPQGQGHTTRGWHCSPKYCSVWNVCMGKHLINDGKADVEMPSLTERMKK